VVFLARDGRAEPAAPGAALRGEALGGSALRRTSDGPVEGAERRALQPFTAERLAYRGRAARGGHGHSQSTLALYEDREAFALVGINDGSHTRHHAPIQSPTASSRPLWADPT
jgi:hypothetical protein